MTATKSWCVRAIARAAPLPAFRPVPNPRLYPRRWRIRQRPYPQKLLSRTSIGSGGSAHRCAANVLAHSAAWCEDPKDEPVEKGGFGSPHHAHTQSRPRPNENTRGKEKV